MPLTLWRRHTPDCNVRHKGRDSVKCSCPIWTDGELQGRRHRRSLKVRDWQKAIKRMAQLESADRPVLKAVGDATAAWLAQLEVAEASRFRYRRILRRLEAFCKAEAIDAMADLDLEGLDRFRKGRLGKPSKDGEPRPLAGVTSARELQVLRSFLAFCLERRWVGENFAMKIKGPRGFKPNEVHPYTAEEMAEIVAACGQIGRTNYERLRARGMVLLMRFTGLRISDVATLARDRVRDGKIMLFTQKTAGHILLPIPAEVEAALAALPEARGDGHDRGYFFWNTVGSRRTVIGRAERTMAAVFRKAKVQGAHAHRFRHTLATDVLAKGGTIQDVADILGISPAVALRHYAKWSQARQDRIFALMKAVQVGTIPAQTEKGAVIQ